jgi:hypothetical protein
LAISALARLAGIGFQFVIDGFGGAATKPDGKQRKRD